MRPLVLYHDNCPDGFTAAWAVWCDLGDTAEYRGVNYGQQPPEDVDGRRVVLVDFSYPRAALDAVAAQAASVEVYDHHKTAQADLAGWTGGKVVFDMERSGAGIAWDEFNQDGAYYIGLRPKLIDYVEDRDLWRWALPHSREISEYLFSVPRTFDDWSAVRDALGWNASPWTAQGEAIIAAGTALLRAKRERVAAMCKHVRWGMIGGCAVPYVNASWDFSEVGEYLAAGNTTAAFGAYYFDRADARQWGMRTQRADVDVSVVAKGYGGGGHRAAAGFQTEIGWLPTEA